MSADTQRWVAGVEQSTEDDALPNFWCDVGGGDILDISDVADWNTCILGCNIIELIYIVGNGFGVAEGVLNGIMVHGAASFPIFLIVQI